MISETSEIKKLDESTKGISHLKDEIKEKNSITKKPNKKNKSNLLFQNDINIKKPKYFGKTKTLLFFGETPIFILGESSNNQLYKNKIYFKII